MDSAENVTRYVGVLIAVIGSFAVTPEGSRLLIDSGCSTVRRWQRRATGLLARWVPRFRTPAQVNTVQRAGGVAAVTSSAYGSADVWNDSATTELKVDRLRALIQGLQVEIATLRAETSERDFELRAQVHDLSQNLSSEIQRLENRLSAAEEKTAKVDARALPVTGLGVVLSGIPGEISRLPVWALGPFLALMLGVALSVASSAWTDRHETP